MTALGLPARGQLRNRAIAAVLVGATLWVIDGALSMAAGSAAVFFILMVTIDTAAVAIGDYADNAALGVLTLVFTAAMSLPEPWLPFIVVGTLVGGWLLFDGVQHLRHGEARNELSRPYSHDGGLLSGFLRAMGARLLEPFRL